MRRCDAINLAKPDPTILVKGLTSIVQGVLAGNPQASFRTSLVRSSLKVDVAPDYKSVEDFHAHLLAEMEGLATGAGASMEPPPSTSVVSSAKVRELRADQGRQENMPNLTAASSPRTPTSGEDKRASSKKIGNAVPVLRKDAKGLCSRVQVSVQTWMGGNGLKGPVLDLRRQGSLRQGVPHQEGITGEAPNTKGAYLLHDNNVGRGSSKDGEGG